MFAVCSYELVYFIQHRLTSIFALFACYCCREGLLH